MTTELYVVVQMGVAGVTEETMASEADLAQARECFRGSLDDLSLVGGVSNNVSILATGESTSPQGSLASTVHAQMCAHARSIGALALSPMFDHSAIMAIARMLVDGLTMFTYLTEIVSEDAMRLRLDVLHLHDTAARIKLVRAFQSKEEQLSLREGREEIIKKIKGNEVFTTMEELERQRLTTGEEMFVGGMRRAAEQAGWDEDKFKSLYNYLSAHVHAAPMSYFRMRQHAVDYYQPSVAQFSSAALAISIATACLRRATLRYLADSQAAQAGIHDGVLKQLRAEDESCTVFGASEQHGSDGNSGGGIEAIQ